MQNNQQNTSNNYKQNGHVKRFKEKKVIPSDYWEDQNSMD